MNQNNNKLNWIVKQKIASLKAQIDYMNEIECFKLASELTKDLEALEQKDPIAMIETGYIAREYSWEAVQAARAKYSKVTN